MNEPLPLPSARSLVVGQRRIEFESTEGGELLTLTGQWPYLFLIILTFRKKLKFQSLQISVYSKPLLKATPQS